MKIENLFLTKGETLLYLQDKVSACVIPKTMLVKVSDFITDPVAQLEMIESYFSLPNTKLAIRSSARDEDSSGQSQAGLYQSFLNVDLDRNTIQSAIVSVLDSYSQKGKTEDFCEGQVIIQEMVRGVASAGVIFTKE